LKDESEIQVERSSKKVYTSLNYLGLFLLLTSSMVIFTPALELFPSVAPNGWEALVWIAWGIAIFTFAIIFLIITNLFKFLSKGQEEKSESKSGISWFQSIKIPVLALILMYLLSFLFI
tara:strand:- start:121 stop:477 length:357 start_codon:yes stop_codon:yes gene_type:complete